MNRVMKGGTHAARASVAGLAITTQQLTHALLFIKQTKDTRVMTSTPGTRSRCFAISSGCRSTVTDGQGWTRRDRPPVVLLISSGQGAGSGSRCLVEGCRRTRTPSIFRASASHAPRWYRF